MALEMACCLCGEIKEHLKTGKVEEFGKVNYHVYRCLGCDTNFYLKVDRTGPNEVVFTTNAIDEINF